jgi:DNA-binding LacI/PurR family transcriptional regulator/signal transduction histidine kinase/ActR/RegA family two-component response regulator
MTCETGTSETRSPRRRSLALLTGNASLGDSYQGAVKWGVEQACTRHDINLLAYVGITNRIHTGDLHKIYYLVDPSRIDAIIFAAGEIASHASLSEMIKTIMERCPVPICTIGQHCPGIPSILVDNKAGTARLVDHLVQDHGYRHFAYIAGPEGNHDSDQRLIGTRESLERHGLRLSPEAVVRGSFSISTGSDAVCQLLEQGTKLEVIVCANDDMALGALDAVTAAGLHCPKDVVITGFDDAASARFSNPPLTTVRQPAAQLGSIAVDYIVGVLDGEASCDTITHPTELIVRESCGCKPSKALLLHLKSSTEQVSDGPPVIEISRLLTPQYDDDDQRDQWIQKLIASAIEETEGHEGAFPKTLDAMLTALPFPYLPLHEFQQVITLLARWVETLNKSTTVDQAFQTALMLVGDHMYRRAGERQLRNETLVNELRKNWEHFSTALSLSVLKSNLLLELPRLGIPNAVISLFESTSHKFLLPWVCLRDGAPVHLPNTPYRSVLVVPEQIPAMTVRQSLTILPLTFEAKLFGIAVLELPIGLDAYALLREQISSALMAVKKHEDFLAKERLRAKIEEEHRLTNEQLHSLSVIAGGVAHDLNNVLGPMMALPDTIELDLLNSDAVPEAVFEDLELMRQASQRAAHIISDLFLLGRTQETPRTYLSLSHLLSKEAATFRAPPGREEITVEIHVEPSDLVIQGSKSHLVRAILNLVINAAKAIDKKGTIRIVAKRVQLEKTLAGYTSIPRGVYAVVEVSDDGCGIPQEHLPRIMEPFFTMSNRPDRAGSGLGLAIVHRIAKESQGYIHVESVPGKGATFSLYFPLADRQVAPSKPPSDVTGGSEHLLVVDDETVQLRAAQRMLKHLGYQVTTVQSGEAAIDLFKEEEISERFDLVIVDMLMPGLDGVETVGQIRRHQPKQKAVIASGYAPEKTSVIANERGMSWLAKPYTLPILAKTVREALNEK